MLMFIFLQNAKETGTRWQKIGNVTEEAMRDALQKILQGKSIRHVSKERKSHSVCNPTPI